MMILGRFVLGMKVLEWYIDLYGIETIFFLSHLYYIGIKIMKNPCTVFLGDIKKDDANSTMIYTDVGLVYR
jgi:hypothetical protein